MNAVVVLAAAEQQLPEDVGKSGPLGLFLILVLLAATVLLVRSMSTHLRKLPRSFEPQEHVEVPDSPAELIERPPPSPGEDVLDALRRAPRAIEPPRARDGRPGASGPPA